MAGAFTWTRSLRGREAPGRTPAVSPPERLETARRRCAPGQTGKPWRVPDEASPVWAPRSGHARVERLWGVTLKVWTAVPLSAVSVAHGQPQSENSKWKTAEISNSSAADRAPSDVARASLPVPLGAWVRPVPVTSALDALPAPQPLTAVTVVLFHQLVVFSPAGPHLQVTPQPRGVCAESDAVCGSRQPRGRRARNTFPVGVERLLRFQPWKCIGKQAQKKKKQVLHKN